MKTVVIYDENMLESTLAAAAVASIFPVETCERKCFPGIEFDRYLWIGVVPTKQYFLRTDLPLVESKEHIAITRLANVKKQDDFLKSVDFIHSSSTEGGEGAGFNLSASFGEHTLIERALRTLGGEPSQFAGLNYFVKEFYKKEASIEAILMTALNMKEALFALENGETYSFITQSTEALADAREYLDALEKRAKRGLSKRSVFMATEHPKTKVKFRFYTMFEPKEWWYYQRRFMIMGGECRNITLASTGCVIISDKVHRADVEHLNPVYVY